MVMVMVMVMVLVVVVMLTTAVTLKQLQHPPSQVKSAAVLANAHDFIR